MQRLADDVHDGRPAVRECFFQRLAEIARLGNAPALHPEGGGHRGVVCDFEVYPKVALVVGRLLSRLDPAIRAVGDHDESNRQPITHHGFELAAGEAEAAVAHHRHALHIRPREMSADGRRHRVAERAVGAVGEEPPPGFPRRVISREVGTRRAGIGDHDRVRIERPGRVRDYPLGLDWFVVGLSERMKSSELFFLGFLHR